MRPDVHRRRGHPAVPVLPYHRVQLSGGPPPTDARRATSPSSLSALSDDDPRDRHDRGVATTAGSRSACSPLAGRAAGGEGAAPRRCSTGRRPATRCASRHSADDAQRRGRRRRRRSPPTAAADDPDRVLAVDRARRAPPSQVHLLLAETPDRHGVHAARRRRDAPHAPPAASSFLIPVATTSVRLRAPAPLR